MNNNVEIFNNFDMVVSVSQKAINDQLKHLMLMGTIPSSLIVAQSYDEEGNASFQQLDSANDVPMANSTTPSVSCLIADSVLPQIAIEESGDNITFILKFESGTAWFWSGYGPSAVLKPYDMAGWQYGIVMDLNLEQLEKDAIASNSQIPDLVKEQLTEFTSNMFSVSYLFLDFESTDLATYDPTNTISASDEAKDQLVLFMIGYLSSLQADNNPYILGYVASADTGCTDENVSDSLLPVGTTYTMFQDTSSSDLSTLNYCLVTKGGYGKITTSPDVFPSNWIKSTDDCDGKMIYSAAVLIEDLILRPIFDSVRTSVYNNIKGSVSCSIGADYDDAKTTSDAGNYSDMSPAPNIEYIISNDTSGDNRYVNRFAVAMNYDDTAVTLTFSGYCYVYKEKSKNTGFCTATCKSTASSTWGGTIKIVTSKDSNGNSILQLENNLASTGSKHSNDQNDCAKTWDVLGDILDFATLGFIDSSFFGDLFSDLFTVNIDGIGDISVVFENLPTQVNSVVLLPAGDAFFFKSPSIDSLGDFSMALTYKSES